MKIVRDGHEYELTQAEIESAHREWENDFVLSEIRYELESEALKTLGDDMLLYKFCEHNGITDDELVAEIADEYRIHCENYDAFGLDKPSIRSVVESVLDDYDFYNYESVE